jgi:hypothetical protein
MKRFLIFLIIFLFPVSTNAASLIFSSGFESNVSISSATDIGSYWSFTMDGSDNGYDWCSDMPGAHIAPYDTCYWNLALPDSVTYSEYFAHEIDTLTGHLGSSTKALHLQIKKKYSSGGTAARFQLNVEPIGSIPPNNLEEYYMQYWVKFGSNWATSLSDNQNVLLWTQASCVSSDTVKLYVGHVSSINGDDFFWRVWSESPSSVWIENKVVPVPIDEWFKLGIYFKNSTTSTGRVVIYVNDVAIINYQAANNICSYVGVFNPFKLYTFDSSAFDIWYDDFLLYDGLPELPVDGTPPDPADAPEFVSAVLNKSSQIEIYFNKPVDVNNSGGFSLLNVDNSEDIDAYVSGDGTSKLTYSLTGAIPTSDTDITLTYVGPAADAIEEQEDGTDLEDFSGVFVTHVSVLAFTGNGTGTMTGNGTGTLTYAVE